MSDERDSGGLIGTIISLLILAAIWPYLLALLALFMAYMAVLAIVEWIGQHPWLSVAMAMGLLSVWAIFYFTLIPKTWRWAIAHLRLQSDKDNRTHNHQRTFIPSTNLYCYSCTKKLGIKAWQCGGKYYCDQCKTIKG